MEPAAEVDAHLHAMERAAGHKFGQVDEPLLLALAIEEGRAIRPDLTLGVCGEYGGDPESIRFFNDVGLDYVSCSPFRVPFARLEAGRAAIGEADGTTDVAESGITPAVAGT